MNAPAIVRAPIFKEVKRLRGNKPFMPSEVRSLDAAIDEALSSALAVIPPPRPSQGLGLRTSQRGIDLIHSFETCKLEAYPDPGSKDGHPWTIGWGSTGSGISRGVRWTQEQCDERFKRDLAKFEDGVTRLLAGAPTTQNQFDALVSLAYNIGLDEDADTIAEGLGDSSLLRRHKAGDYERAADAFGSWVFNDGRKMRGLERRRAAEEAMYRSGAPK